MNEETLLRVAEDLRSRTLVDHGGLLKPGGRRELESALAVYREQDRTARVLLLPRGENMEPWREVWNLLQLDSSRHLLLLFNGERWEARGWGLSPDAVGRALSGAEADLRKYYALGLVAALRGLAEEASIDSGPIDAESSDGDIPLTGGALALVAGAGALGFILRRRMKIAEEERRASKLGDLREALSSAREIYAEVILRGDEIALLNPERAQELQLRAADLGDRLDDLEREASDSGTRPEMLHARAVQFENELRAAHSALLQEKLRQEKQLQEPS